MSVQARFFIASVERFVGENGKVKLQPVTRGGANAEWAQATPSGLIEMTVNNPSALAWFDERRGAELKITFEDRPADE